MLLLSTALFSLIFTTLFSAFLLCFTPFHISKVQRVPAWQCF